MRLSPIAARVLGALVEKRLTTPAQYPLSVAALQTACNQRSARDPVMELSEGQVQTGLSELRSDSLCRTSPVRGRVHKHEHLLERQLDLDEAAQTVLGVLLLRGPQTVGEIRTRTERWHDFPSLEAVEAVLTRLAEHPFVALAAELPREPGRREARWTDLLTDHAPGLTPGLTPGVTLGTEDSVTPPSDGRVVVRETAPPVPTAGQL
ncbi:MAG: hypothetical protein ACJA2H_000695, partial [Nitriliruptoraceae bacterium]